MLTLGVTEDKPEIKAKRGFSFWETFTYITFSLLFVVFPILPGFCQVWILIWTQDVLRVVFHPSSVYPFFFRVVVCYHLSTAPAPCPVVCRVNLMTYLCFMLRCVFRVCAQVPVRMRRCHAQIMHKNFCLYYPAGAGGQEHIPRENQMGERWSGLGGRIPLAARDWE